MATKITPIPSSEPSAEASEPNAGRCAGTTGSQIGNVIIFALYSIAFEAIVWGLFGWAVFIQGRSGWWVLVALMLSGSQLKPKHFGIRQR